MKIYEAISMLEQMDPTKECTVTFGQPKSLLGFPQLPLHQQYFQPQWLKDTKVGPVTPYSFCETNTTLAH